jgi:integrase
LKREIDLTPYVPAIMDLAEKTSLRDWLILSLLGAGAGFRRGEVVGTRDRRMVWPIGMFTSPKKKSELPLRKAILQRLLEGVPRVKDAEGNIYSLIREKQFVLKLRTEASLSGLQIEDFQDGGVYLKRKGGKERFKVLPPKLYAKCLEYFGNRKTGQAFDWSPAFVFNLVRKYCRDVGVPNWQRAHPHRFRAAFAVLTYDKSGHDLALTQQEMGHSRPDTTLRYVGERPIELKRQVAGSIFEELSA